MEDMVKDAKMREFSLIKPSPAFWKGKTVCITGHTGFKGSWLSLWLVRMGAAVYGISLPEQGQYKLYESLDLEKELKSFWIDIRSYSELVECMGKIRPHVVIHLAAQPLVRQSYEMPRATWETNVMGTINVLEAIRSTCDKLCSVVVCTTDKVYSNNEWLYSYRECDRLGGHDPYSSSKAAAEIAVEGWRKSFFEIEKKIFVSTARAGNVIGGGDWANERIMPDIIRSACAKSPIVLRKPYSIRPWQHVLEPLSGYLLLAQAMYIDQNFERSPYNFGPQNDGHKKVIELVKESLKHWPGSEVVIKPDGGPHEAGLLKLSIEKAEEALSWKPRWSFEESVERTVKWYKKVHEDPGTERARCMDDIQAYSG